MSNFDDNNLNRDGLEQPVVGPRSGRRKQAEKSTKKKKKRKVEKEEDLGFWASIAAFFRRRVDPDRRRLRKLPDLSEYPDGNAPLWVTDPMHYTRRKPWILRFLKGCWTFILHMICLGGIIGVIALGVMVSVIYSFSDPELDERFATMDMDYTSFIYATNPTTGESYVYQSVESSSGNRIWVSGDEISQNVKNATIAIEDKRFYQHMGVDPIRLVRAVLEYSFAYVTHRPTSGIGGGSTLTQQVIKNITGKDDQTPTRKIKEMLQALYIERRYDKDQILEYYLNTVYFGSGANGVAAAAKTYFGKDVSELDPLEAATIIVITKSPTAFDPTLYPERNRTRRINCLWYMYQQGFITQEEFELYRNAEPDLVANRDQPEEEVETTKTVYSYYTDMVIRDVIADLKAEGYTEAEANRLVYRGGLQIYACIDPDIQSYLESFFSNEDNFKYKGSEKDVITLEDGSVELPQLAMMVTNPDTGAILAVIGGRGEKEKSFSLNRATHAVRQPGSSIKPLSVYGYAIENDILTLGSAIDDVPVLTDEEGYKWPVNYNRNYNGMISVFRALSGSLNTPAARALEMVGIAKSYDFMVNTLHFKNLVAADGQSLAPLSVGALTHGVTVREMVTAYSIFACEGIYTYTRSYDRVVSHDGSILLDNAVEREEVFSAETAFLITDILHGAVTSAASAGQANLGDIYTAGKSGTTNEYKDRWFVGYTDDYLAGIWWGYDTPSELNNTHHIVMWHDVMLEIHHMKGITESSMDKPSDIISCSVCYKSGKLPGPYCSSDPRGSCVQTFYYKRGTEPTETCDVHHQLYVCAESNRIAHEGCPEKVLRTFVDIQRSFKCEITVSDGGTVCPRLTEGMVLLVDRKYPCYALPEGEFPGVSSSSSGRSNCVCTTHEYYGDAPNYLTDPEMVIVPPTPSVPENGETGDPTDPSVNGGETPAPINETTSENTGTPIPVSP